MAIPRNLKSCRTDLLPEPETQPNQVGDFDLLTGPGKLCRRSLGLGQGMISYTNSLSERRFL
jgi:hypothetical protein